MRNAKSDFLFHLIVIACSILAAAAYYLLCAAYLSSKVPSGSQLFIDEHLGVGAFDMALLGGGIALANGPALERLLHVPLLTQEDRALVGYARGALFGPLGITVLLLIPFTVGGMGVVAIKDATVYVWTTDGQDAGRSFIHRETCSVRDLRLEPHEKGENTGFYFVTPAGYIMRDFVNQGRLRDCIRGERRAGVPSHKRFNLTNRPREVCSAWERARPVQAQHARRGSGLLCSKEPRCSPRRSEGGLVFRGHLTGSHCAGSSRGTRSLMLLACLASVNWIRTSVSVFANASSCAVAPLAQVLALVINAVRGVTGLSPISRLTLQQRCFCRLALSDVAI